MEQVGDLISYLENKNFESSEINKVVNYAIKHNIMNVDYVKKLDSIYTIFGYTDLPDIKINLLILKNMRMLVKHDHEIIKIAYVWYITGLLTEESTINNGLNIVEIRRTYLRYCYFNSGFRNKSLKISYNSITMSDLEFSEDYCTKINNNFSRPSAERLIDYYGKGDSLEEKAGYIDYTIQHLANTWFRNALQKNRQRIANVRSI